MLADEVQNSYQYQSSWSAIVTAGWLLFTLGCGEPRPEGMPELYPVTLEFTLGGAPLDAASVRLVPLDPSHPWLSGGITDASGKARLRVHGDYDGVPAGKYKICVTKTERAGESAPVDMMNLGPEGTAKTATVFTLVDPKYGAPSSTPLEIEVAVGENSFEPFNLGDVVRMEETGPQY